MSPKYIKMHGDNIVYKSAKILKIPKINHFSDTLAINYRGGKGAPLSHHVTKQLNRNHLSHLCVAINIGDRQKGRLRASSVIDCEEEHKAISQSINKALSKNFQKTLRQIHHPYKSGNASKAISEVLKSFKLDGILAKEFCDIKR